MHGECRTFEKVDFCWNVEDKMGQINSAMEPVGNGGVLDVFPNFFYIKVEFI